MEKRSTRPRVSTQDFVITLILHFCNTTSLFSQSKFLNRTSQLNVGSGIQILISIFTSTMSQVNLVVLT